MQLFDLFRPFCSALFFLTQAFKSCFSHFAKSICPPAQTPDIEENLIPPSPPMRIPVKKSSYKENMTWFHKLFGAEENPKTLQNVFKCSYDANNNAIIQVGSRSFQAGKFSCPTLADLRNDVDQLLTNPLIQEWLKENSNKFTYNHIVTGDALELHAQYPNSVIQAASQFNCLEFPTFHATPEQGITGKCVK